LGVYFAVPVGLVLHPTVHLVATRIGPHPHRRHHQSIHWAAIFTAVGAVVVAVLALLGALVAYNVTRRATTKVTGTVHERAGRWVLRSCVEVRATGIGTMRFPKASAADPATDIKPRLVVTEVRATGSGAEETDPVFVKNVLDDDEVVYPGEMAAETRYDLLPEPVPALIGWRLVFTCAIQRRLRRKDYWWWMATEFVPLPVPGEMPTTSDPDVTESRPGAVRWRVEG
jgi:hypothetical protein